MIILVFQSSSTLFFSGRLHLEYDFHIAAGQKLDKAQLWIKAGLSFEGGRLMIEFARV